MAQRKEPTMAQIRERTGSMSKPHRGPYPQFNTTQIDFIKRRMEAHLEWHDDPIAREIVEIIVHSEGCSPRFKEPLE